MGRIGEMPAGWTRVETAPTGVRIPSFVSNPCIHVRKERVMDSNSARATIAVAAAVVVIVLSGLTGYIYHANEVTERMDALEGGAQTHYIDIISNGE